MAGPDSPTDTATALTCNNIALNTLAHINIHSLVSAGCEFCVWETHLGEARRSLYGINKEKLWVSECGYRWAGSMCMRVYLQEEGAKKRVLTAHRREFSHTAIFRRRMHL